MLLSELSRSRLFNTFRELDKFRSQLTRLYEGESSIEYPPFNVFSSEEGAVITSEVPGIEAANIDISVVNDTLTVRGSREKEEIQEGERIHRQERGHGEFVRSIQLPFRIDADKVEAKFVKGILHINLPRAEQDKPKKIAVQK